MNGTRQGDFPGNRLSRRERQIMDVVYRLGRATATEIVEGIPDPPTKDAVRRLIRILEEKGLLRHEVDGPRHVYHPTLARIRRGSPHWIICCKPTSEGRYPRPSLRFWNLPPTT